MHVRFEKQQTIRTKSHMYSSLALVQTTDLDLREEVNWCFNESNRCECAVIHRRCVLVALTRNLCWVRHAVAHSRSNV